MKITNGQDKPVTPQKKQGSTLVRGLLTGAVIGVVAMSSAQAAGQRSQESYNQAQQRNLDTLNTGRFEQEVHQDKMARKRAEASAELKRKNAAAKAAAEEAARAAAAQAAQPATPATPAAPATPATPATPAAVQP